MLTKVGFVGGGGGGAEANASSEWVYACLKVVMPNFLGMLGYSILLNNNIPFYRSDNLLKLCTVKIWYYPIP